MERVTWTDDRLDDLARSMDAGFERVDRDIRDLRVEIRAVDLSLRTEMRTGFAELRGLMLRMNGGLLLAIVAAKLLHGF